MSPSLWGLGDLPQEEKLLTGDGYKGERVIKRGSLILPRRSQGSSNLAGHSEEAAHSGTAAGKMDTGKVEGKRKSREKDVGWLDSLAGDSREEEG